MALFSPPKWTSYYSDSYGIARGPWVTKTILKKSNVGVLIFRRFKTYCKATVIKIVWCWYKARCVHQWNRIERPEINLYIDGQLTFDKGACPFSGERTVSLTAGAGTSGFPHAKNHPILWSWMKAQWKLDALTSHVRQKINSNRSVTYIYELKL